MTDELEGVIADVRRLPYGPAAGAPLFGRIQTADDGSFFWHPSESADGEVLDLFDRVTFHRPTGSGGRARRQSDCWNAMRGPREPSPTSPGNAAGAGMPSPGRPMSRPLLRRSPSGFHRSRARTVGRRGAVASGA